MNGNTHSPPPYMTVSLHESSRVTEKQKGANFFRLVTDNTNNADWS